MCNLYSVTKGQAAIIAANDIFSVVAAQEAKEKGGASSHVRSCALAEAALQPLSDRQTHIRTD